MQLKNQQILQVLPVALTLAGVAQPVAALPWDDQRGDCLTAFVKPDAAESKQLVNCADAFGSTARLDRLSAGDRKTIEHGLRWLYEQGDSAGSHLARESLLRLGVQVPARVAPTGRAAHIPHGPRHRYDPPEVRSSERDAAAKLAQEAVPLLKKQKWREAQAKLHVALGKDPRSEAALYNLACAEANAVATQPDALGHLQDLADLGTEDATARLVKARTDVDFDLLRDDTEFKRITGALRVLVVNTIGVAGEPAVENVQKLLVELGQRKPDVRDDDQAPLDHPRLTFRAHAKAQTALLADWLDHPKVELQPMPADALLKYDIVLQWGAKVTVIDGQRHADRAGPDTAEDQMQAARRQQNKVLAQPDQAIGKVDRVVATPERTYTEGQNMGKRVGATVDKAKGSLDKVKSLGEKLNKL